jgi:Kdo2-lipid IVA lauroyltransferase/acyltransferase
MKPFIVLLHPKNWLVWFAMALLRLLVMLPLRLQLMIGRGFGRLLYRVAGARRRVVQINIALCFPKMSKQQQHLLVKQHFLSIGMMLPEIGLSWWASKRRISKFTEIEGLEHLDKAIAQGKGAILLGAHYSTLEIGLFLLTTQTDIPVCGMYRPHKNAVIELLMRRGRTRYLDKLIARDDIRGLIKSIKQNKAVWYAPDQSYQDKGYAMIPFFGIPASTNLSTSRIAKLSKTLVIPFVSVRKGDNSGYKLTIKPPLENFPSGNDTDDAVRVHQVFEEHIRQQPDQYFWIHKRFKNRNNKQFDQYLNYKDEE